MFGKLIEVEFLEQHGCHKKGDKESLFPRYAKYLIDEKIAKAIDLPMKDKMIRQASNKGIL